MSRKRAGRGKKYRIVADIMRIFRRNPNKLYTPRDIRHALPQHDEASLYKNLMILYGVGRLNKDVISGRRYYWIRR